MCASESVDYDEAAELTNYIRRSFRDLMTPDELLADDAFVVELKIMNGGDAVVALLERQRSRYQSNSYVSAALKLGYAGFQAQVRDRFLQDMPEGFFINRCPACQKVVATSQAKQCLWCGENWHVVN